MRPADTLEIVGRGELEVVITRRFKAPAALVFECFTNPELVRRWHGGPDPWKVTACRIDLKVGGSFRIEMANPADGRTMGISGVYRQIERPTRLVTDETMDPPFDAGTTVTATFEEQGGETLYTAIETYPSTEIREMARTTMRKGVEAMYLRVDAMLAEGAVPAA